MPKISIITTSIRPKGLEIVRQSLLAQTFTDFEWLVDINWTGKHDLNAAYNRCLKRAKGELVVSLQDYIKIEPGALQSLWEYYLDHKNTFFTCPVGKVDNEEYEGEPVWDWRAHEGAQPDWRMWEIDFGGAPLSALKEIGGFDEYTDGMWSMDNVNVGCRADIAGYEFDCVRDVRGVAYDHDAFIAHPFRSQYKPLLQNMRMDEFRDGFTLPKLR